MDHSIYYKIIQESPLIFKIKDIASEIYDSWRVHTKPKYPDYLFEANVKTLETDLRMALAKSLKWLWKEEKEEKRKRPDWSTGFILGCISSTLSTEWSYQYVYIETDEYKQLLLLKTLIQYLDVDRITVERLKKLYNYFLDKKTDLIGEINNKNEIVVYLDKFKKEKKDVLHDEFKKKLIKYLENILLEKHHVIFDSILGNQYLPEISNFITDDEINFLICQSGEKNK